MVETKIIILDQQEIVYKIHYKRIKNCYLRVEKGRSGDSLFTAVFSK